MLVEAHLGEGQSSSLTSTAVGPLPDQVRHGGPFPMASSWMAAPPGQAAWPAVVQAEGDPVPQDRDASSASCRTANP
jgi:hypothetical protein